MANFTPKTSPYRCKMATTREREKGAHVLSNAGVHPCQSLTAIEGETTWRTDVIEYNRWEIGYNLGSKEWDGQS